MNDAPLAGCRILVAEDEYLLADEVAYALGVAGATIAGPAPTVERARALLDGADPIDGAVLDLNLGGEPAFPVADLLIGRGIPVIFTTGYDVRATPERFAHVAHCEKPVDIGRVTAALCEAIRAPR